MPVNMPDQTTKAILCFVMYFIIKVTAKVEQIERCPRGHARNERQRNLCGNASLYHCIPDSKCQLYQFCADPQEPPRIDTLFMFNDSIHNISIETLTFTNTELYEDLSLYFCKYSLEMSNNKLFEAIVKRLDTNATNNSFKQPCTPPDVEHVLPTFDSCQINFKCAETRNVSDFKLLVYQNGKLVSHQFKIGLSNQSGFYKVDFLLCFLNNNKLNEYTLEADTISTIKDNSSNAHSHGTIIGSIVGTLCTLIIIIVAIFVIKKRLSRRTQESFLI